MVNFLLIKGGTLCMNGPNRLRSFITGPATNQCTVCLGFFYKQLGFSLDSSCISEKKDLGNLGPSGLDK